ncbi:hypothetical protein [Peptostreptococcus equinus]|uniref:Uncharacterized protein n=1 Tax=Peptostreptococcus equinus TaxID=3003601 RepID=A0ABY7JPE7_9FIRM|nr:hypothetical protein [Peptostreptococcus sp. CBA3647]WAW14018.1 hypothetical protein O0R46_05275 [Peptostreptococcus sp. CBA3647]
MEKIDRKQFRNSLLFALGACGVDLFIKTNNGTFNSQFNNNIVKCIIYYVLLFVIVFVLSNLAYKKLKKYNGFS